MRNLKSDINRYSYGLEKSLIKLILISFTKLGFWAVTNYRLGVYFREKSKPFKILHYPILLITSITRLVIEILTGISISYYSKIGPGMLIAHFSNVIIGDGVEIGANATLHQGVTIGVSGRDEKRGVPSIGDDFFAGANAVIAGKIKIGNKVSVSANSFVYCDIEDNSVVISSVLKVINKNGKDHA
ncbi:serine acetyltransferase [Vibrio anguillarum]|uniref:serine O-acetyltransferase n=1 Tax=Vibrio anguillarum TaxID=55601 RepID=UPI00169EEE5D|nr:serine acetyltransferase [Vibrio anguillarum]MCC4237777.1 serine acetyltransferase [Vibrio anguillarum]MDT3847656.1 serine acetyltransferase [Vibrio anguillarum]NOI05048.1 serine acetyltransferase [Vibrio anguillarum]